ncbi:MAG: hypothetical protein KBD19_04300 [Candidatus Moranbacteria bacterium]|nr:hypothetical protein [Candidatus Moranbacteria bacterium]
MPSPYQEFLEKARARFQANREKKRSGSFAMTRHAEFKMRQYGLSEQKVRGVIRNPRRREEGVAKDTVAVMQPVSPKRDAKGAETWKQEIWVMFQQRIKNQKSKIKIDDLAPQRQIKIISAWRYPGVSPKRNPIPEEILREIEEGSILEEEY